MSEPSDSLREQFGDIDVYLFAQEVPSRRFRVERVESMSHDADSMDVVISSAVWRVLAPGGLLFARLATTVGQPHLRPLGGGRNPAREDIIVHAGPSSLAHTAADVLGVQRRERRMVAGSGPGTRAAIAYLRASLGGHVVLFLDYLDHVVQREVAGERDSTTRDELIEPTRN